MGAVYASGEYYAENFGAPPAAAEPILEPLLARASRILRAECAAAGVNLDQAISDGLIEVELVADAVCQMVTEAGESAGWAGVSQHSQTAGAYTESMSFRETAGRLYVGRDIRRMLGLSRQRAFTVDTTPKGAA